MSISTPTGAGEHLRIDPTKLNMALHQRPYVAGKCPDYGDVIIHQNTDGGYRIDLSLADNIKCRWDFDERGNCTKRNYVDPRDPLKLSPIVPSGVIGDPLGFVDLNTLLATFEPAMDDGLRTTEFPLIRDALKKTAGIADLPTPTDARSSEVDAR